MKHTPEAHVMANEFEALLEHNGSYDNGGWTSWFESQDVGTRVRVWEVDRNLGGPALRTGRWIDYHINKKIVRSDFLMPHKPAIVMVELIEIERGRTDNPYAGLSVGPAYGEPQSNE